MQSRRSPAARYVDLQGDGKRDRHALIHRDADVEELLLGTERSVERHRARLDRGEAARLDVLDDVELEDEPPVRFSRDARSTSVTLP
jgi:hypothetical protein